MSYQLIAKCSVQQVFIRPKHNRTFVQRLLHRMLLFDPAV